MALLFKYLKESNHLIVEFIYQTMKTKYVKNSEKEIAANIAIELKVSILACWSIPCGMCKKLKKERFKKKKKKTNSST